MIRRTLALMLPLCPRICSDSTAYRPAYMLFVLYKCIETLRMHNINAFFFSYIAYYKSIKHKHCFSLNSSTHALCLQRSVSYSFKFSE